MAPMYYIYNYVQLCIYILHLDMTYILQNVAYTIFYITF